MTEDDRVNRLTFSPPYVVYGIASKIAVSNEEVLTCNSHNVVHGPDQRQSVDVQLGRITHFSHFVAGYALVEAAIIYSHTRDIQLPDWKYKYTINKYSVIKDGINSSTFLTTSVPRESRDTMSNRIKNHTAS